MDYRIKKAPLPDFITMMEMLISLPTISSPQIQCDQSNMAVIECLANWLDELGFNVEVQHLTGSVHKKANLIACLGSGPGGLVLSGHTDTVPYDDRRWSSDPFKLMEKDQRLYGLGTCDMKGFFPIVLSTLQQMSGEPLSRPLTVLATADEESSMSGARAIVESGKLSAEFALIGEPTGLNPVRMHKGIMMERIQVRGQSGHSSNPDLGNSAMEAMHEVMTQLLRYRNQIQENYRNADFEVEVPTLNLGHIHGGDSPNRICGHCELDFDLRPLPGMNIVDLQEDIQKLVAGVSRSRGIDINVEHLFGGAPPFETSRSSDIVRLSEKLTGVPATSVAFATEAPYLQKLGMETIVLGAGSIDQAHQPDEFLALDQVVPMQNVVRNLIENFCR